MTARYQAAERLLATRRASLSAWERRLTEELGPQRDKTPRDRTLLLLAYARRLYALGELRVAKLKERP